MGKEMRITGLWIYPIKSCRGISLPEMQITKTGPAFDRQWMFVDHEYKFITLRTQSKLSQVLPSLNSQSMILKFDDQSVEVPLDQDSKRVEAVTVWKDTFQAGIESDEINNKFSEFFGQKVKLVRYQKDSFRDLQTAASSVVKETMFADSRPILLTNENSLNDLNQKLDTQSLDRSHMERFRSNIIISGLEAFQEDNFKSWSINGVTFENPKLCARCPVITQDVATGKVVSKETLLTLADYRKVDGKKIMFGVNLTPSSLGKIYLDDLVQGFVD